MEEVKAEETVEEVKTAETETDPWAEEIDVFVPRFRKGEDEFYYVCVNDRRFSVPRNGKTQKLPRPIGEVLIMGMEAENKAQDTAESIHVNEPVPGAIG